MKRLLLALVFVCPIFAQWDDYTVSFSATLSAAGTALSVQLPATGDQTVEVTEATVGTSGSCVIRLERNGAAATGVNATAVTAVALNPESTPAALQTTPKFTAWSGTGIPAGTAVTPNWTLPAGAIMPFGGGRVLMGAGTSRNYILRVVSPCTGTVSLFFSVRSAR